MTRIFKARRPVFAAVIIASAGLALPASTMAQAQTFAADYSISFAGIPVARSSFSTIVKGDTLSLKGRLSSAGLGSVFSSTNATSSITGKVTAAGVQTQTYSLDFKSGKRSRSTTVRFSGGDVTEAVVTPPRKPNASVVPVENAHLKGVVDPFFASLVAASSASEVCNRTIRIFDGTSRSDLVLRPAGAEAVSVGAFKGEGVRCAVRYVPVSGHRANSSGIRYMAEGERATITFASLPGTGLYAPVKASVKTKNGTVSIKATRFEQVAD